MAWQRLTAEQVRILQCAKEGRPPWDCVPARAAVVAELNQLIAFDLIHDQPPSYGLTQKGALALAERGFN